MIIINFLGDIAFDPENVSGGGGTKPIVRDCVLNAFYFIGGHYKPQETMIIEKKDPFNHVRPAHRVENYADAP